MNHLRQLSTPLQQKKKCRRLSHPFPGSKSNAQTAEILTGYTDAKIIASKHAASALIAKQELIAMQRIRLYSLHQQKSSSRSPPAATTRTGKGTRAAAGREHKAVPARVSPEVHTLRRKSGTTSRAAGGGSDHNHEAEGHDHQAGGHGTHLKKTTWHRCDNLHRPLHPLPKSQELSVVLDLLIFFCERARQHWTKRRHSTRLWTSSYTSCALTKCDTTAHLMPKLKQWCRSWKRCSTT